jgi:hypothetical protein
MQTCIDVSVAGVKTPLRLIMNGSNPRPIFVIEGLPTKGRSAAKVDNQSLEAFAGNLPLDGYYLVLPNI